MGPSDRADRRQRTDAMRRRKAERQRLIKERLAIPGDLPRAHGEKIAASFRRAIGDVAAPTVSACWPFRGEPDRRGFLDRLRPPGGRTAPPVVIVRGQPVIFRAWARGEPLERAVWNIPPDDPSPAP
jgi:5-formyltetrahydrofolate cyclo-ligase